MILIVDTGPLALIEDLGRPGFAHLGVPPSGAADRTSCGLANRLVGNDETDAVIEVTLGGLIVAAGQFHWIAVTGPPTQLWINDEPTASHAALPLRPGQRLRIDPPKNGVRSYLAVRGGLSLPKTLGSRSTDVLSGLGPAPLRPGMTIHTGQPTRALPGIDVAPQREPSKDLDLFPGPRRNWFTGEAWARLVGEKWIVSADADRIGSDSRVPSSIAALRMSCPQRA